MATATAKAANSKVAPPADWRVIFLSDIGAPVTKTNLAFLDLWARFEGGMSHNNPLNTSLRTSHSTGTWNSSGVQNYDTVANGAHAAAQTLLNTPAKGYSAILAGFRGNVALPTLAARVEMSPWDAGHYGGYNSKGQYVGGKLFNAALPGVHKPGLGDFLGLAGHYAIHPGAGVDKTATAAKKAAEKPVLDTLHYILYGLAVAGGGALVITGVILIAADIGLSKRGPRDYGGSALRTIRSGDGESEPTADERVSAAYAEGKQRGREKRARKLGEMRSQTSRNDVRAEAAYRDRSYRASRQGISKKDSVKIVKPKVDVSRRLKKVS